MQAPPTVDAWATVDGTGKQFLTSCFLMKQGIAMLLQVSMVFLSVNIWHCVGNGAPRQHSMKVISIFIMEHSSPLCSIRGRHGSVSQCPGSHKETRQRGCLSVQSGASSLRIFCFGTLSSTNDHQTCIFPALVHSAAPSSLRTCISLCGDNLYVPFDPGCESSVLIGCPMTRSGGRLWWQICKHIIISLNYRTV